jgi:hypothetical protein
MPGKLENLYNSLPNGPAPENLFPRLAAQVAGPALVHLLDCPLEITDFVHADSLSDRRRSAIPISN